MEEHNWTKVGSRIKDIQGAEALQVFYVCTECDKWTSELFKNEDRVYNTDSECYPKKENMKGLIGGKTTKELRDEVLKFLESNRETFKVSQICDELDLDPEHESHRRKIRSVLRSLKEKGLVEEIMSIGEGYLWFASSCGGDDW